MKYGFSLLEDWMRNYYYTAKMDIGSSGVSCFSFKELREKVGISLEEIDALVFQDATSYGDDQLRQELSSRFSNGNPECVMVTHGSSEGIYLVMNSLLQAGDEVIVLSPAYHSHTSIAEVIGCQIKTWTLHEERGFVPDVEELRALVTPETKMVLVNFPHNPTGATLTEEQLKQVIEICSQVDAYLLWDAAFHDLVYTAGPLTDPTLTYDRAISLGTFSKAYGLPGMRFGWCIAAPEVLEEMVPLRDVMTLALSPLIELLALRTVQGLDALRDVRLQEARHNLDVLENWVEANSNVVEWSRPHGGVTAFPKFNITISVEELCHELGREHNVLLVPGAAFDHPDRVRLGFGGTTAELTEALDRLGHLLQRYKKA